MTLKYLVVCLTCIIQKIKPSGLRIITVSIVPVPLMVIMANHLVPLSAVGLVRSPIALLLTAPPIALLLVRPPIILILLLVRPASRGTSRHDASHHPQAASRDSPEAGLDTNNDDDRDCDSDRLRDDRKNQTRATRNSKYNGDAKPNQLGFYSGAWVDILITARNNFRKMIHAESGPTRPSFPERNPENLRRAQDHLIEAVAEYSEEWSAAG